MMDQGMQPNMPWSMTSDTVRVWKMASALTSSDECEASEDDEDDEDEDEDEEEEDDEEDDEEEEDEEEEESSPDEDDARVGSREMMPDEDEDGVAAEDGGESLLERIGAGEDMPSNASLPW